jgi:galactitol-specific phosphotransferase system IIB component
MMTELYNNIEEFIGNASNNEENNEQTVLNTTQENTVVEVQNDNGWTSLFLTKVNKTETVDSMSYKLNNKYGIGVVKRIDFITKSKNINEKTDNYYQKYNSCFVHFYYWYNNEFTNELRKTLEETGKYNIYVVDGSDRFLIHINNNPINETPLNIHQIATNTEIMEQNVLMLSSKLNEQYAIINQQQSYINQLIYDMNELKNKVYGV